MVDFIDPENNAVVFCQALFKISKFPRVSDLFLVDLIPITRAPNPPWRQIT